MIHTCILTVRSYECDSNLHVNNAVYLNYLEHARMEFLKSIGFDFYHFRTKGFALIVSKVVVQYKKPAVLDDALSISTYSIKKGITSGILRQIIKRNDIVICEADITWVCVNPQGKPAKLPEEFNKKELYPGAHEKV